MKSNETFMIIACDCREVFHVIITTVRPSNLDECNASTKQIRKNTRKKHIGK